ncbi:MAG: methyltransferase domain-containing protein [Planctomycetales bacterium]
MLMFPDLSTRQLGSEVMDNPELDRESHIAALKGLSRLNWISHSARILWQPIRQLARSQASTPLRVLDIATGSGDIPIALGQRAAKENIPLHLTAIDVSPRALEFAACRATAANVDIDFRQGDVRRDHFGTGFDVVICSLFLHHLEREHAVDLLQQMAVATNHLLLVNDLRRCQMGYFLAYTAGRLFTRSRVVHVDGPLSVKAAFTMAEVEQMAKQAGLSSARIGRRWPCRYLLQWDKGFA